MFGLSLMEASDKHAGPPASLHTPDSVCSGDAISPFASASRQIVWTGPAPTVH